MRVTVTPLGMSIGMMLLLGALSLVASINYNSSILAFIGLGLIFWGAILLYIKPEEYTRKILLEAALSPSVTTLNQLIQDFGYRGYVTYLPPKYFSNPETTKLFISKYKHRILPKPEKTQLIENQPVVATMQGLLLTPPGVELSKLLEKSLGKSFIQADLETLKRRLPELFIEKLEIAEDLELQTETDTEKTNLTSPAKSTTLHAKITRPVCGTTFKEAGNPTQPTGLIGDPICSAIAIALTKATGKPVRIADTKTSEDSNTLEATFKIMED